MSVYERAWGRKKTAIKGGFHQSKTMAFTLNAVFVVTWQIKQVNYRNIARLLTHYYMWFAVLRRPVPLAVILVLSHLFHDIPTPEISPHFIPGLLDLLSYASLHWLAFVFIQLSSSICIIYPYQQSFNIMCTMLIMKVYIAH